MEQMKKGALGEICGLYRKRKSATSVQAAVRRHVIPVSSTPPPTADAVFSVNTALLFVREGRPCTPGDSGQMDQGWKRLPHQDELTMWDSQCRGPLTLPKARRACGRAVSVCRLCHRGWPGCVNCDQEETVHT